ncbi:MAG TPA: hypothetical protein VGM09_10645 [Bradyrhizobium sp.]
MADEAFALSPISARAAQPTEQDYDAISEAFMETSRGRWFLGEYAKRNRNADTRMVLDAVERIEQSLAAQREPEPAPALDNGLAEAIEAIKAALQEARAAASAAIDNLALEQHLAPVHKGARVIREISWRWREIGADSRICDLIDSQVSAIEASCGQLATADPRSELKAAFDLIGRQIAAFDDSDDAAEQVAVEAAAAPSPAPSTEMPAASIEQAEAEVTASAQAAPVEQAVATVEAAAEMTVQAADVSADVADPAPQAPDVTANAEAPAVTEAEMPAEAAAEVAAADNIDDEAADAEDDAVLDLIAAEMSASDVSDAHLVDVDEAETLPAAPETIAPVEEVAVAPEMAPAIGPSTPAALAPALGPKAQPSPQPGPEPSIGSTLLAGGLLRGQGTNDPLAALRRLSQAEKIALFS